jgi:glycosyltransferase involved in cell wall biosynthesis
VLTLGRLKPGLDAIPQLWSEFRETCRDLVCCGDDGISFTLDQLEWVVAGDSSYLRWSLPGLRCYGVVSEAEKWDLLRGALVVIHPSLHESLSLTLLEAWSARRPVLIDSRCIVAAAQAKRSGGGDFYDGPADFGKCLAALLANHQRRCQLGSRASIWVEATYQWERIIGDYLKVIEEISTIDVIKQNLDWGYGTKHS